MTGHFVDSAVLLAKPEPPAFFLGEIVVDLQAYDRADPRKAVSHDGYKCPVPEARDAKYIHGDERFAGLLGREHRRRSLAYRMAWPVDGVRRV
jgi:hypothetical protein